MLVTICIIVYIYIVLSFNNICRQDLMPYRSTALRQIASLLLFQHNLWSCSLQCTTQGPKINIFSDAGVQKGSCYPAWPRGYNRKI